ncbi:MAG: cyclic nucleotide-binding domain-containing protein, partial [Magnetococcales bacterium]|nr:cyclic nucleotide-binding domain-containing protein [Magnetococcales bacterium]
RVLVTLEAGAVIGELAFLTKRPRATNVIAVDDVTIFTISSASMEKLDLSVQMKIKDQLIRILVSRLDETTQKFSQQKEINQTLVRALRDMGTR